MSAEIVGVMMAEVVVPSNSWQVTIAEPISCASVTLTPCQHSLHCGPSIRITGQTHAASIQVAA